MFFSSWLSCSYFPFFSGHFHFFSFPLVFSTLLRPLILVCANFKLRKSKVSQPNFHCTLIYFCIKHFWGVSKHIVFDLVFTFSNIFWHFFDISTRGFLSGPGSYQPCLRGNDRVGQINDSSTDVQFKLYKLFNGKKYGILHEFQHITWIRWLGVKTHHLKKCLHLHGLPMCCLQHRLPISSCAPTVQVTQSWDIIQTFTSNILSKTTYKQHQTTKGRNIARGKGYFLLARKSCGVLASNAADLGGKVSCAFSHWCQ